ncbi:PKD domain-containing protein [Aureispira anguillae]|uniref:PKD domain-containing protein n=1 Tax=Aureispira anguillae TaxID=2864201 RepID=A0A916DU88_9BACT|nr:PKD domain-containing protein [Aureispira anguillae]BDS12477.1 PKD domain-containing protein [Aureispira anguillae]
MKYFNYVIGWLFCILFFLSSSTYASHIVGGEMTYNCLGNNQYEILLTIFRDCENGNPAAYFDQPAYVGIYNATTGAYLRTEALLLPNDDTLDLAQSNPCYNIPSNVCIHTTTYRRQITLPNNSNGYHLVYQRCCRNNVITNIIDPGQTGATYDVVISGDALASCNSSPRFREWPPFYICQGTSINYDNSAFDPDGDSIVYELCNPYDGATTLDPRPNPPAGPPFSSVNWRFPYGLNNMLGGADPFRIDPVTGMLAGTPPSLGIFVVGICAKEYRNGVLIGITKRDFQYEVVACTPLQAQFAVNLSPCNASLSVLHLNTSTSLGVTFDWDFGDNSPSVTGVNPVHTYPDTGTYTVQMIAGVGLSCVDTVVRQVRVHLDGADVSVPPQVACVGDTVLLVANNLLANYNNIVTYNWSPNSALLSGQGTDSVYVIANNNINLSLTATNDNGCIDVENTNVQLEIVEALFDSVTFDCNTTLDIPFNNQSTSVTNSYFWDFDGTGTSTNAFPVNTFPDTGRYEVTLVAGYGALCQDTFTREIYIPLDGASILSTSPTQACKGDTLILSVTNELADYNNIGGYTWVPNSPILSGQGTDSIQIVADVNTVFTVNVENENGCVDTVVLPLQVLQMNAVFDSVELVCNKSLEIPFTNSSVDLTLNFLWDFGGTGTSTDVSPTYTFPDTGTYTVSLIGGIGTSCPDTFRQVIDVRLDGAEIVASDTQLVCRGDTVLLTALNTLSLYNTMIDYSWSPITNIITGQGTDSVNVLANADLDFQVIGLNDAGCRDTAFAHVNVTTISPALAIVALPDSIFVGQTSQLYATNFLEYSYDWTPDTTLSAYDIHDPIAKPRQTKTYYLRVTNQYCTHNDSVTVYIKPPICANPVVFVPSAFSPDGDGHNDVLMVNGNNINEMTMAIYNRWGQKVFETNDQNLGWDGTYLGRELPPDVYGYYMQCKCDEGGTLFLKGNITLLK